MKRVIIVLTLALAAGGALGDETNLVHEVARRLSVSAFADVESSYWARGAIVDKNPFSAQCVAAEFSLEPFGRIGGYAWSATAMSRSGQSSTRQNFYNEVDYQAHYGYDWEFVPEWTLTTDVGPKWVTLPGYHPHAPTFYEWNVMQSLKNPYVTPYYLMRRAYYQAEWCYWDVGLYRSWEICRDLTATVKFFGELGNSRHFRSQYGANPNDPRGDYSNGLMALNVLVRLDYAVTNWFGLYAFVQQFDVVSPDARDALDASTTPESLKDLTIFGIGLALKF